MKLRIIFAMCLGLFSWVSFLSCSVQIDTVLAADQSARVEMQAIIHPVLRDYLKDLSGGKQDFFSEASIRKRLAEEKGLSIQHIEASMDKGISIGVKVADIRQILSGKTGDIRNAIVLSDVGGQKRLIFNLNRQTIEAFLGMGGSNSELKYLLPQDAALTAKQYQDQLNWALEEYGTTAQLADMFKTSVIKMRLTVPGAIKSVKGFTIIDRKAGIVGLELNLVELLTLHTTMINEVAY